MVYTIFRNIQEEPPNVSQKDVAEIGHPFSEQVYIGVFMKCSDLSNCIKLYILENFW